ncbi:CRISPR-associated endonuclease Cas1 [Chloroflexia bacterium SDU3-3]|nr:CRISPR-associated endonuclease Cas1 [Chloroflexia bacterium SDU3-3]
MYLIVEQRGAFVAKHQGRLRVTKDKERLAEVPLMHLEQVLICSDGVALSSDVVRICAEEGIPLHFLNGRDGNDYGTLFASGLTGMALTKRAQLRAYEDARGLALAKAFARGKIQSQANMLRYAAKYRRESDPAAHAALTAAAAEVLDTLPALDRVAGVVDEATRSAVMGAEGRAAARYWAAVAQLIPPELAWPGRETQGATDRFNQALNYGYAVLRAQVRVALLLAGLEPNAGFLHADRPGKPSLSLDLIEEFRQPVVDRTLIGLVNRGAELAQQEDGGLDAATRRRIAEKVLERMDSSELFEAKRQPLRHILQLQARHIATYVRGERGEYAPFVMGW